MNLALELIIILTVPWVLLITMCIIIDYIKKRKLIKFERDHPLYIAFCEENSRMKEIEFDAHKIILQAKNAINEAREEMQYYPHDSGRHAQYEDLIRRKQETIEAATIEYEKLCQTRQNYIKANLPAVLEEIGDCPQATEWKKTYEYLLEQEKE